MSGIGITGKFTPKNSGEFPLLEDTSLEGGYQTCTDLTARDDINSLNRKIGMLVYVVSNDTFYQLIGGITNFDWQIAPLGSDEIVTDFSGFGLIQGGVVEVSTNISHARFVAEFSTTPDLVILTDDDGTDPKDVTGLTEFYSDGYFQKNAVGESVVFTLTVTFGMSTVIKTFEVVWTQRNFYGIGISGENTDSFILGLSSIISKDLNTIFVATAGVSEKIYFAHSTSFGTPILNFNGFEGGFFLVSDSISVTNSYGFSDEYSLWESDNSNLGQTTIEVYPS